MMQFVNPLDLNINLENDLPKVSSERREDIAEHVYYMRNLMTAHETQQFLDQTSSITWLPVGLNGMKGDYQEGDAIGSWRASTYNEAVADALWQRVKDHVPVDRTMHQLSAVDDDGHESWKAVGINPLLRLIKYTDGGVLVPHYDAPYIASEEVRTQMSVVIYLDAAQGLTGGRTRFLHDPQVGTPVAQRNLDDWNHLATPEDIRVNVSPEAGTALVFDHRILHDSELVTGTGQKTIIRTDILFRKV